VCLWEFGARVLATGIVNLLQTVDVDHVVLAGEDLIRRSDTYVAAVRDAVLLEVPRADWRRVQVTVSGLGPDVVAAGAAMEVLDQRFGVPGTGPAAVGAAYEESRRERSQAPVSNRALRPYERRPDSQTPSLR
jgi:predicted NBD/HSP70 family sugar kinase